MKLHAMPLALTMLLLGCGGTLPDPDEMPAGFGEIQKRWSGCPDVSGLYAWPPMDRPPTVQATGPYSNTERTFLGLPIYPQAQLWVNGPSDETGQKLELRTRQLHSNPNYPIPAQAQQWRLLTVSDFDCDGGWLTWQSLRGDPNRSGRMTLLADGNLAVGQALRVDGRRGPIFSWGGQTYGDTPLPDKVGTGWARLQRIGATGEGVPNAGTEVTRQRE